MTDATLKEGDDIAPQHRISLERSDELGQECASHRASQRAAVIACARRHNPQVAGDAPGAPGEFSYSANADARATIHARKRSKYGSPMLLASRCTASAASATCPIAVAFGKLARWS